MKPTDQNRIRDLEHTVAKLERSIEGLLSNRSMSNIDQIIRPAKTTGPVGGGSYPSTGEVVPIVFQDMGWSGVGDSISFSNRSSAAQASAAILDGGLIPTGTKVAVFRYGLKWVVIPSTSGVQLTYIKAPNAGIPKRVGNVLGSAMCYICTFSSTTGMYTVTADQIQVFNPISSVVLDKGDHFGRAAFFEGGWHVDVGDCGDSGSGLGTAGMVFYGTGSTGTYTAPA